MHVLKVMKCLFKFYGRCMYIKNLASSYFRLTEPQVTSPWLTLNVMSFDFFMFQFIEMLYICIGHVIPYYDELKSIWRVVFFWLWLGGSPLPLSFGDVRLIYLYIIMFSLSFIVFLHLHVMLYYGFLIFNSFIPCKEFYFFVSFLDTP